MICLDQSEAGIDQSEGLIHHEKLSGYYEWIQESFSGRLLKCDQAQGYYNTFIKSDKEVSTKAKGDHMKVFTCQSQLVMVMLARMLSACLLQ